jgi:predicted metalloprotease
MQGVMRWIPGGTSGDIEDRRGLSIGGRGIGLGGLIILGILSLIFGRDFITPFLGTSPSPRASDPARKAKEEPVVQFVSFVLDDAQKTWSEVLPRYGANYRRAKLVLFHDAVDSACGMAQSATGPFYCPPDEKIYIDLGFYDELRRRFGAPGEFAQAYVLAHEIGHHVQRILGIEQQMRRAQRQDPAAANQLSVRLELQADCFAGIWGHSTAERQILESGDVEAGLRAAAAVGDDRLQRMAGRGVSPEAFTHGSSAQRVEWFRRGLETGNVPACDTFRDGR